MPLDTVLRIHDEMIYGIRIFIRCDTTYDVFIMDRIRIWTHVAEMNTSTKFPRICAYQIHNSTPSPSESGKS